MAEPTNHFGTDNIVVCSESVAVAFSKTLTSGILTAGGNIIVTYPDGVGSGAIRDLIREVHEHLVPAAKKLISGDD